MSEHPSHPMNNHPLLHARFESEFRVRPDDIDMNMHVHNSRYLDYVLAARYDQMERCYGVSMEEFMRHGFGWVQRSGTITYRKPLRLGEYFTVRTWIETIASRGVDVGFEIIRRTDAQTACEGLFSYVMINIASGRAERIPDWIREKYSV